MFTRSRAYSAWSGPVSRPAARSAAFMPAPTTTEAFTQSQVDA